MSRRSRGHESKPYNPKDDPYFVQDYRVHTSNFTGGLAIVTVFGGSGAVIFKKLGWAGILAIVAIAVLIAAVWILLRRSRIKSAAEPGFINRHNMKTRECITPREKKLKERFYNMDCGLCGKSTSVQAINLRKKKCPHCGSKRIKY